MSKSNLSLKKSPLKFLLNTICVYFIDLRCAWRKNDTKNLLNLILVALLHTEDEW
jgi:hypothetical protein